MIVKDLRNIDLTFGLVYPNSKEIGMSSYAIRLLYYLINLNDNIACERIFLPKSVKFPASIDNLSSKSILSAENTLAPKDFDILGFSIHSENDFRNVLWILDKAGIPLTSKERNQEKGSEKNYPIIIAGGPVVTSNPLPIANYIDILFIGDSEHNLDPFLKLCIDYKNKNLTIRQFLEKSCSISGIFVPVLRNKVVRALLRDLDSVPSPNYQLFSSNSSKDIFESYYFIEINRGCPYQCKFCLSSYHNFPFRNQSYDHIENAIKEALKISDVNVISLIGSCVSAHPKFQEICEYIVNNNKRIAIPSIRMEHINPKILNILEKGDVKTITIAPETGSEKLRYALGKKISNDMVISVVNQIRNSSIKNVKFYFLIGLPNETLEDVREILTLLKEIEKLKFPKYSLKVNINPFVPKSSTPYQNDVSHFLKENIAILRQKYNLLLKELKNSASFKLKFLEFKNIIKNARIQALFSLGDWNTGELLKVYYLNGANLGALRRAEKELDMSVNDYLLKIGSGYIPWKLNLE